MAQEDHITASEGWFIGEDKTLTVTIYQSDGTTPQDITGWALSWMLKTKKTDADASALVTKTTSAGIVLTTPAAGLCTVSVTDEDTDPLRANTYWHELKRTDAGLETILTYGSCELRQSVHRA